MHRPESINSMFQSASKTSRVFEAKFPGTCASCGGDIEQGEDVMFSDDELVHAECTEVPVRTAQKVCDKCWTVHAGECL